MFGLDEIASKPPFSLCKNEKNALFERALGELSSLHCDQCADYKNIVLGLGFDPDAPHRVEDFPFLPVRLFKTRDLLSVERSEIVKTMTSSGTTGQAASKIYLDRGTSAAQTKALAKIASDFLGGARLPMLIIDSTEALKDRNMFSARGAGILGFSMLGRDATYALDDGMRLNFSAVSDFLERHAGENIFVFGFTFMIWEHFYKAIERSGRHLPLDNGILIHGGGWKKMQGEAVDAAKFKEGLREACGLRRVYNYYGMVEQTGSIFMECGEGRLHCSVFSDVLVRDHRDFSVRPIGEPGLLQVISLLPRSYPGHSLLTEDIGCLTGEDDCPCGRLGKTFRIDGRAPQAEARGCSDTYERR
ncbi:MAG: hypothetical protein LBQ36_02835 [Synergistaceae bacterium]|jgi:hypothetical protein|nr:hypothetical protein [Synergistaceae bacterium]